MIDDIAAMVHRTAQDRAEFARKRIGDHALALDQAGIAVARFLSHPAAVYKHGVAATLLQVQSDADSYHPRSENDHISAHVRSRSAASVGRMALQAGPNQMTPASCSSAISLAERPSQPE